MAYSYTTFVGDGVLNILSIPFQFLNKEHIKITLDGVETSGFEWLNGTTVRLASAPAVGVLIKIRRDTPKDRALTDFSNDSILLESDLDLQMTQLLMVAQEAYDALVTAMAVDAATDQYAVVGQRKIEGLGDPTNPQDAATKSYVDRFALAAQAQVDAATALKQQTSDIRDATEALRAATQALKEGADTSAAQAQAHATSANASAQQATTEANRAKGEADKAVTEANRAQSEASAAALKALEVDAAVASAQATITAAAVAQVTAINTVPQPQTIMRCKMKAPLDSPYHDLALPDFLSFSGRTITLRADPTTPFEVCFGNGGTNTIGSLTSDLSVVVPNVATTYWLYVQRNPETGVLTLGVTDIPPEYNYTRIGVDALPLHTANAGVFGTASASVEYLPAWNAFDRNAATEWNTGAVPPAWLQYRFTQVRRLVGYIVQGRKVNSNDLAYSPKNWVLSADGVVVDTRTNQVDWPVGEGKGHVYRFASPLDATTIRMDISANNGGINTGCGGFIPLFAGDWYNPASNMMMDESGIQVQRVYIGRCVLSGGAVTSVMPFHPGVFTLIPGNGGNTTLAATWMYENNPFGTPIILSPPEIYDSAGPQWCRQMDYFNNSGTADGVWLYSYDNAAIRWICYSSNRLGKYRIPVRRAF